MCAGCPDGDVGHAGVFQAPQPCGRPPRGGSANRSGDPPRPPATVARRRAAALSGGLNRGLNRPSIRDAVVTARQYEPEPRKL